MTRNYSAEARFDKLFGLCEMQVTYDTSNVTYLKGTWIIEHGSPVTYETLKAVAYVFGTDKINIGSETGYYDERFTTIEIIDINPPKDVEEYL